MAARALDHLEGGLVGAVLIVSETVPGRPDMSQSSWFVPDGQRWTMTVGVVEEWRVDQQAMLTASALRAAHDDDDEGEGGGGDGVG